MIVSRSHGIAGAGVAVGRAAPQVDDELAVDRDRHRRALVEDRCRRWGTKLASKASRTALNRSSHVPSMPMRRTVVRCARNARHPACWRDVDLRAPDQHPRRRAGQPRRPRGPGAAARQRGVEVRADAAVHRARGAPARRTATAASACSGSRATSSAARSRAAPRRSPRSARRRYGVSFPMFEKIEVNGPGRHPIYEELTDGRRRRGPRRRHPLELREVPRRRRRRRHPVQPDGRARRPDARRRHRGRPAGLTPDAAP